MLGKLTKKQLIQHDKKQTLFHEQGHSIVASYFGVFGKVNLSRNPLGGIEEKFWIGSYTMYNDPTEVELPDEVKAVIKYMLPPKNWKALIGMAGFVAEQIANGETDGNKISSSLEEAIEMEEISHTDCAMIGEDWEWGDVDSVLKILLDRWDTVERFVNYHL